jgi:hypothetical protein
MEFGRNGMIKPRTNNDRLSTVTCSVILKYIAISACAGDIMDEPREPTNASMLICHVINALYRGLKDLGSSPELK